MRCDACREPIGDAFFVVDGQDWCPRCQRGVARRTPAWRGLLGGLAGGVAADLRMAVLLTALPVVMVFDGIIGALSFLSLVIGMSASSAVAGGDPIAIDGPFEATPEPASPVPAF